MSTFTDDDLLNNSTRLMSTKVRFFLERRQETHDALTTKKKQIGHSRDPQRFAKQKVEEEIKLAPFEGPEIVTHQSDTSEQNKSGQNGEKKHRGCSRNALGGFFSS